MNKTMQQPNGPGPTMAKQAAFVNGRGTRLVGAPDSPLDVNAVILAALNRRCRRLEHFDNETENALRLGKIIGTASRH